MTKPMTRIHDLETNEIIDREMTDEEFALFEAAKVEAEIKNAEETLKATAKAALLAQLGITEDQAKLLFS